MDGIIDYLKQETIELVSDIIRDEKEDRFFISLKALEIIAFLDGMKERLNES